MQAQQQQQQAATTVVMAQAPATTPQQQFKFDKDTVMLWINGHDQFNSPDWKRARIFAIFHFLFEFLYLCLVVGVTGFSVIWPILIMIGHGIILGMCCCKDDNGKNGGIVVVVMNSIGLVGFIIDLFVIGFVSAVCDIWQDEVDRGVEKQSDVPSSCSVVGAAAAFNWICLILRIVAIVLASKVSCCRAAPPSVTVITTGGAAPAAGIPIAAQATMV